MTAAFDPSSDLETVADGLTSVIVRSPGGAEAVVAGALRRAVTTAEAAPSGGKALAIDAVWHLPAAALASPPDVGAAIIDAAGEEWTVLEVESQTLGARWRLRTRRLIIAGGLAALVTIERPNVQKDRHGAARIEWIAVYRHAAARIQPAAMEEDVTHGAVRSTATHLVYLLNPPVILSGDRVRDAAGGVYEVERVRDAERLDAFTILEVRQMSRLR